VLPRKSRRVRPMRRVRRRADLTAPVDLEKRALLAFSPLGFSLPNLAISGQAGPRAAWGGVLDVSVFLQNIGASTTTEPYSQAPPTQAPTPGSPYGSTSTADAPDSVVDVLVSRSPKSLRGAISIGTFEAPPQSQNSVQQIPAAFTLPSRPPGFAGNGGKVYVWFVADSAGQVLQATGANNISKPVPVTITGRALPELRAIALGIPNSLHPDRELRHRGSRSPGTGHGVPGGVGDSKLYARELDRRLVYRRQHTAGLGDADWRELSDLRPADRQSADKRHHHQRKCGHLADQPEEILPRSGRRPGRDARPTQSAAQQPGVDSRRGSAAAASASSRRREHAERRSVSIRSGK
jgi:hypothetical protein